MNHKQGYKVTITTTERLTVTHTIKREIRIEPTANHQKNTATAPTVTVFVVVGEDAGIIKA